MAAGKKTSSKPKALKAAPKKAKSLYDDAYDLNDANEIYGSVLIIAPDASMNHPLTAYAQNTFDVLPEAQRTLLLTHLDESQPDNRYSPFFNEGTTQAFHWRINSYENARMQQKQLHALYATFENDLKTFLRNQSPTIVHVFGIAPLGVEALAAIRRALPTSRIFLSLSDEDLAPLNTSGHDSFFASQQLSTHLKLANTAMFHGKALPRSAESLNLLKVSIAEGTVVGKFCLLYNGQTPK